MYFIQLSAELSCHIDFQDGGLCGAILSSVSDWVNHFLRKVNAYEHTKFRQDNSICGWDITISGLEKQMSAIVKFLFRFRPWLHAHNGHVILHQLAKFHPNRAICGGVMTSYRFLTWPPRLSTTSGFVFRSKSIRRPNLVDISIHRWDIITSVCEKNKRPSLEFYFRFRFRPYCRNPHHILYKSAKFHLCRSTQCGNITSHRFFNMAASATQYYFRFRVCWCHCIQKVKIYQQIKFRRHISVQG